MIGNAYPGWTDIVHGGGVWGQGPGNESGAEYHCGFLFGESFDHCGWLGGKTVTGLPDDDSCGSDCPNGTDTDDLFKPVYTNGNICPQVNKTPNFCNTYMNWLAPTCKDRNAYGNVDPWQDKATPHNLVEQVPHGHYLQWRYVSHDSGWVMVMDPSKDGVTQPNWYFVSSGCVDVVYSPDPPRPAPLPSASSGASSTPAPAPSSSTSSASSSSSSPPPSPAPSSTASSTPPAPPAPALHCCVHCSNRKDAYHADASHMSCAEAAADFCSAAGKDRGHVVDVFEGDCPEAP